MASGSSRRYPVDAKGIGLMQHGKQKTYMMSVLWSDSNNILIYRTFEEFKKLHNDLKKRFPIEAGFLKKSERVLPKFRDARLMFWRARWSNRNIEQLKLLETFSRELLQTDAKVSQCEDVTQFYTPQPQDLNPSFHENSIVIMPSDSGHGRKVSSRLQPPSGITQPIKFDQYQCMEAFETKDTKSRPFKVKQGDFLDVLLKDTTGWWLVENEEKRLAWFPAPYLKKTGTIGKIQAERESVHGGKLYFAVKGYEAKGADELSIDVGVVVEVVQRAENGWWLIWYNGRAGYVPSMFLQPYKNPHQRFQVIVKQDMYMSTPDLHKASSNLDVAGTPNMTAFEDDPTQSSAASKRREESRKALNRKKSRSLNGFPTIAEQTLRPPLALELDMLPGGADGARGHNPDAKCKSTPSPRNVLRVRRAEGDFPCGSPGSSFTRVPVIKKVPREPDQPRKDSGFDDRASMSVSDPLLYPSDLNSPSDVPAVPPRPHANEILQKCTTVTKKAVQGTGQKPV